MVVSLGLGAGESRAAGDGPLRTFTPPAPVMPAASSLGQVRDAVIDREAAPARLMRALERPANEYSDQDGHSVSVEVSEGYLVNLVAEQTLVDYLGSLTHGDEMSKLNVYVATPLEIPQICGGLAAACYYPSDQLMVIVGEATFAGLPTNFVAAHEYGHHVENNRRNTPWPALGWGTKRWSTHQGICPRYLRGGIYPGERIDEFPGDEADFYWQNPGEAFAEAYAKSHSLFALLPWDWIELFEPGAADYRLIRADVNDPWLRNTTRRYSGKVSKRRPLKIRFATPLDGSVAISMRGARGTDFDLELEDAQGRPLDRSTGRGSRERVSSFVCGDPKLGIEVRAFRGKGQARLKVSRP